MEQLRFGYVVDLGKNQLHTPFNQLKNCGRCYCQILSNVVKCCEIVSNISNLSILSSQIGSYNQSSPPHGKTWSQAMHLTKPSRSSTKPSRSSMTCYQLIVVQTHEVVERIWLVGAVFLWLAMILARRQKAQSKSPKIWNCQIWSSGDFQANLGFQKVIPYFSPPTCHDRSTPNGSSAGSWSQSSQTPKRIQPISSYIDILYDYFCPCSVKPQKNELDSVKLHKFWGAENLFEKKHG